MSASFSKAIIVKDIKIVVVMISIVTVVPELLRKGRNPPYIVDVPNRVVNIESPVVTNRISFERLLNDVQY